MTYTWDPRQRGIFFCFVFLALLVARSVDCCLAAKENPPVTKSFDIPSDAADKSLKRFAVQSGLEVAYGTETTAQVRTNPVKGDFTPRMAIDRLLAGTGLIVETDDKTGALTVSRDPNAHQAAQATAGDPPPKKKPPMISQNPTNA